jgi:hypothetical protein
MTAQLWSTTMNIQLTDDERASLREVARGGLMQKRIPPEHQRKLTQLGLIEQTLGGSFAATTKGRLETQRR